ncbi:hypothetical protein [Methylobacterium sp. WL9]|nr:hypothetical protein [Methylobacterium sp. WL9]
MRFSKYGWALCVMIATCVAVSAETAPPIADALANITVLVRPGRVGYVTVWDGNKYVQCRRVPDDSLHCEAGGVTMQPSLAAVLDPNRLQMLGNLGWSLDRSFGNYIRTFPAPMSYAVVAEQILEVLTRAYEANPTDLEINTDWIADIPCPPRNGPSQNLAGSVNDAPAMRAFSIRTCEFKAEPPPLKAETREDVLAQYGGIVAAELQRLRINAKRRVYTVFDVGIGYIQCAPKSPMRILFCEAQSAESWPALAVVLTPQRVARLQAAGFAAPGRSPNYWRDYHLDEMSDADLAKELLSLLGDVYGYSGSTRLMIKTEQF